MRFRVVAVNLGTSLGGLASSAEEALLRMLDLESKGFRHIELTDEEDRKITRPEIFRLAEAERRSSGSSD